MDKDQTLTGSSRIETRDPKDLRPLAAVKDLDAWADDDPRFLEFCEDIKDKGIITELLVTPDNEIIDGRHRWRAANRWQMTSVPVRVVAGKAKDELILMQLSTLAHRRHYTPSQRAYIMYPFMERAHQAILDAHEKQLRTGNVSTISASGGNGGKKGWRTSADLAKSMKVSRDTFDRAAKMHKVFAENNEPRSWDDDTLRRLHLTTKKKWTLKQVFEPQILDEEKPMGLGAAMAGIGSVLEQDKKGGHRGGRPKVAEDQLRLFTDTFKDLDTRYEYWTQFGDDEKSAARKRIKSSLEKMPEDLLKTFSAEVRAELQRREASQS